jgi:hypothetical protein
VRSATLRWPIGPPVAAERATCIGCAMAAGSAASGFRSWLQTRALGWLTPKRMRVLTIGAMCTAGLVSTIGVSGATPPSAHHDAPAQHEARSVSR